MAKSRYLAPWQRKSLDANALKSMSAQSIALLAALQGKPALYHCVSRIVGRAPVLQQEEREQFVRLMRLYERFSQVKVWTYCVMSNHFHILVEIPSRPECGGASWSDERLLDHLSTIYGERKMAELRGELGHYRAQDNDAAAEVFRQKFFARMWDLSQYMKIVKQCFSQWFNRKHGRRGVLWEERFKSELVEDGHAARRVAAYIDLNPVRAGIVPEPENYRWSGYGAATGGVPEAREGLWLVMCEEAATRLDASQAAEDLSDWREVARRYRVVLFEEGEECERDRTKKRAGIPVQRVAEVIGQGGRLSEADLVWCQTRYFLDGVALGLKSFVTMNFEATREYFGGQRRDGARRMRKVQSDLCTLRDLQKGAVRPCGKG
jgi:REP element-mobilizing transposase RayT